jgi:hypothetical protein
MVKEKLLLISKKDEIAQWLYALSINNFLIHDNLIVDIQENVDLSNMNLKVLPFHFGVIDGDFCCNNNLLTNLINAPNTVKGTFSCEYNLLKTLKGAPKAIGKHFIFSGNSVSSFKYLPAHIKGNVVALNNPISSIKELSVIFGGSLVANIMPYFDSKIIELNDFYHDSFLDVPFETIKAIQEKLKMETFLKSSTTTKIQKI